MSIRRWSAALALAALLAEQAVALDGEVLIDQAAVDAGGITPGDDPGFPATLSRGGSYKLTGILSVPANRDGIEVTQDGVSLDLNGFAILSVPALQARTAITARNIVDLTVKNGAIAEFLGNGVSNHDTGSQRALIENMRIVFNGAAGIVVGDDSRMLNNIISANQAGIIGQNRNLIEGNIITASTLGGGVSIQSGGTIRGNVIVANKAAGIAVRFGSSGYGDNILVGNNPGGSQVDGIVRRMHPNLCEPANAAC